MPIQYALVPKQPNENEPWSFEFIPGKNIPLGDTISGTPTVKCYEIVSREVTTSGTDVSSSMIEGISTSGNTVLFRVKAGTNGKWYKVTITAALTGGGSVEEDIVFQVYDY